MRFTELWRSLLAGLGPVCAAAILLASAGCATLQESPPASAPTAPTAPSAAAPAADSPAPGPATAAAATSAIAVAPGVQRDFDAARRALAARRFDEAERALLALTQAHPELGGPFANLAIVYRQSGKHADSVAALERAVQANPREPAYYNQLGIAFRHSGQFAQARDAYQKAIALDPGYAAAILNLGILLDIYLRDGTRALELYERYLALTPAGDDEVRKWISDLKNRGAKSAASRKE